MENELLALKKATKVNQILLIITLVFTFLLCAAFVCVGVTAYMGYQSIAPYIDKLQTINVDQFNTVIDKISSLDVESLTKTLADLEKDMSVVAESLSSMQEAVNNFKSSIGGLFGF